MVDVDFQKQKIHVINVALQHMGERERSGRGVGSVGIYGSVCYLKAICRHCHREWLNPYTRLHACYSHSPYQWFDIMVLRTAWLSKVRQKFCLTCGV